MRDKTSSKLLGAAGFKIGVGWGTLTAGRRAGLADHDLPRSAAVDGRERQWLGTARTRPAVLQGRDGGKERASSAAVIRRAGRNPMAVSVSRSAVQSELAK